MEKSDLISEIIKLEHRANRLIRQHSLDAWMELNLTIPQLKSLFFIANHPSTNSSKLAAALGVTPSNVTGIVDRLVEQGVVSRREKPEDRRALILKVTEKGEAILSGLRERRTSKMLGILGRMSMEELSYLARGLSSLVKAAEIGEEKGEDEHD